MRKKITIEVTNSDNITLDKIARAAIASEQDGEDTLQHMKELLEQTSPAEVDQKIKELSGTTDGLAEVTGQQ